MTISTGNFQPYCVKITNINGNIQRYVLKSYRFEGKNNWRDDEGRIVAVDRVPIFTCPCGSTDFSEDGRWVGEYKCGCCDTFVELILE